MLIPSHQHYQKFFIASVGLLIRCILAFIYYGSHDIDGFIAITGYSLANDLPEAASWHYFPTISMYLWISGFIATYSPLPIAFCIKLIPIFFDVAIAILLFDVARKRMFKNAFHIGLLYALCPVSIIITAIHGQWDALFIFFILLSFYVREFVPDSVAKYIVFGTLFSYAILLKPAACSFLPFFFISPKVFVLRGGAHAHRVLYYQIIGLSSALITLFIAFVGFYVAGLSIVDVFQASIGYCNQGVQVIGLPYALPDDWSTLVNILQNRLWLIGVLGVLAAWYYQGKVHIYRIIGISIAAVLGFSGICPQYLMWLLPFFLIKNAVAWAAFYGFVVSIFYILFYASPLSSSHPEFQSVLSFAPLSALHWAAPPSWIASWQVHSIVTMLGNVIIPTICLVFLISEIQKLRKGLRTVKHYDVKAVVEKPFNIYVWVNALCICFTLLMIYLFRMIDVASLYKQAVAIKMDWYAVTYDGAVRSPVLSGATFLNIVVVLVIASAVWFAYAWGVARQKK